MDVIRSKCWHNLAEHEAWESDILSQDQRGCTSANVMDRLTRIIWPAPWAATRGNMSAFVIQKPHPVHITLIMVYYEIINCWDVKRILHRRMSGRQEAQINWPTESIELKSWSLSRRRGRFFFKSARLYYTYLVIKYERSGDQNNDICDILPLKFRGKSFSRITGPLSGPGV